MRLAQLSDTHLLGDSSASVWGQNPASNLVSILGALPPVDAITVTGDISDDGTVEAYRIADALTATRTPRRYFVPGNHDDPAAMAAVWGAAADVRLTALSDQWVLALVDTQWVGHEAGRLRDGTVERLDAALAGVEAHVVLGVHHPPIGPCDQPDCTLVDAEQLLGVLHDSPVRAVLSGHLHQQFDERVGDITFLGAPSTLNQLCHGGDPHYRDTGEPPAARVVELHDDGTVEHSIVTAELATT